MLEEKVYSLEELGFTEEDVEGFVDTEPTENNTKEQPSQTTEVESEQVQEPPTEENAEPSQGEGDKPHGNLNEALRIERARRKAAEQQAQA